MFIILRVVAELTDNSYEIIIRVKYMVLLKVDVQIRISIK